jgi:magnesium transporter
MRSIIEYQGTTWIDIQDPGKEDIDFLRGKFAFHPIVFEQLTRPSWATKVETFSEHLFLVLFFPVYNKERRETRARELDLIVTKDTLITSHVKSSLPLMKLLSQCNLYEEARKKYMEQGAPFLMYSLLHELWEDCGVKIQRIGKKLESIEESIFQGKEKEMLREISVVKADIINFWKIARPQKGVVTSLRDTALESFGKEIAPYFSHLRNHWARATSNLIAYKETVEALEDTNNSLLSYKTNEIVRILTVFSVILLPLTFISQLFVINTASLPFAGKSYDFWIVMGILLVAFLITVGYFKSKKWL